MGNRLNDIFSFPHPANEIAARWVAAMVVSLTVAIILTDQYWLIAVLLYGFAARVLTGPSLSPMGLLATKVIVPALGNPQKPVAGPPKRFAQAVGLVFSLTALLFVYVLDNSVAAEITMGILVVFAFMESALGFCAGCFVFGKLMQFGLIPEEVCERCADIWA